MSKLKFERKEKIGTLTLSSPENLNAMDEEMAKAFHAKVNELKSEDLRVLILTGEGKAFSAGGNLEMLEEKTKLSKEENKKRMLDFYQSFLSVRDLHVPLIAAINGHAIGAGLCLALACDIRVVAKEAKLGLTFTKLGLHPGMGATWFLPQVAGRALASELLLTGRVIKGKEAASHQLSSEIHDAKDVVKRAREIAKEILSCGPQATKQLLESLRNGSASLDDTLTREAERQSDNYASDEFLDRVKRARNSSGLI